MKKLEVGVMDKKIVLLALGFSFLLLAGCLGSARATPSPSAYASVTAVPTASVGGTANALTTATPSSIPSASSTPETTPTASPTSGNTIFENKDFGVWLEYPSNWEKKENYMNSLVTLLAPRDGESDGFSENLNLITRPVLDNATVGQYAASVENELKGAYGAGSVVESGVTVVSGIPSRKIIFASPFGNFSLQTLMVVSLKNDTAYVFTYTAEKTAYQKFLPAMQGVFDSVRLG